MVHFLIFLPPNNLKSQNFKKIPKILWDIIILHKCTKNHDDMLYCFWDMACDEYNCYFFILGYFLPFYPPKQPEKSKLKKERKNCLEISSFYTTVTKIMIICYTISEIWRVTEVIAIFLFGLFLTFYPSNSPKNQNFKSKMKKNLEISSFYTYGPKIIIDDVQFLRYGARRTDGQTNGRTKGRTDGLKKWHIELGVLPKTKRKNLSTFYLK